ncbi:c-type cytochrome [Lysobacter sp. A3-1-A15]|uniref:c-type cytochrome n=1 Tax=Novilysobacter viscosus TaxID=3098602 RepID=UPI002EDB0EEA
MSVTRMCAGLVLCGAAAVAQAQAPDPAQLASSGADGLASCASCHGARGEGMAAMPRLAGINAAYLRKQLEDFASGTREHALMSPIAKAMSPETREAMAGYYGAMRLPAGAAPTGVHPGARVAERGAWDRNVPGCVQCHGPGGRGVGDAFPAIAGQTADYLSTQLEAWKSGRRSNDPIGLMQAAARGLTAEEIRDVSDYFSRQPMQAPR